MIDTTRPTSQIVFDAIVELHNAEQIVTREVLRDVTGLKMTVIDDHIKTMCDNERVRRIKNGVFAPMLAPPPARAVSVTSIPGGLCKIEVGDTCLELWPREERLLGKLLAGAAVEYSNIQTGHEAGIVAVELMGRIKRLERELAGYREKKDEQQSLFEPNSEMAIEKGPSS